MVSNWHVIGYTWKENGVYLQVRKPKPDSPTQDLELSGEITFRKLGERRCVGWIDFEKLEIMPCPDNARDVTQCDACKKREGFMGCVMCNGFNCPPLKPSVERYCRQKHHLYLACFGNENVKVGTASDIRKNVRVWEQGPLAAAYVASAPGPVIKQIEYTVSRLGYTEAMRRTEKRNLLTSGMNEDEARKLIGLALEDINQRLSSSYIEHFHPPEFAEMPELAKKSRRYSSLDDVVADVDQIIGGKISAASGHMLIFEDSLGPLVLDLATLKSWLIEVNPEGSLPTRTKQLPLF